MKKFVLSVIVSFVLLSGCGGCSNKSTFEQTANAFSQVSCPANIAAVRNDSRFSKAPSDDLIYFLRGQPLLCSYYRTGKIREEVPGIFNNGNFIRHGTMKAFFETDSLRIEILYQNDSPISGSCYNSYGSTNSLSSADLKGWENGYSIGCIY